METNKSNKIKKGSKRKNRTITITMVAMFSALAYVTTCLCKFIPPVAGFLSLEIKDAVITLCSLLFGPFSALCIAVIVPLIECYTISTTEWYGLIMNILSSATFCLVTGLIYKYKRSFYGAIVALVAGVFSVTAVMMVANLLITPLYLTYIGAPSTMADVAAMIPKTLLPFNFLKATINAAIVLLVYKPLSIALKRARLITNTSLEVRKNATSITKTIIVSVVSFLIVVAATVLIFTVL